MSQQLEKIKGVIKLIRQGYRDYFGKIVALGVVEMSGSFLESLGVTVLIPIFGLLTNSGELGSDAISKAIMSVFSWLRIALDVKYLLIFVVILFLFKFVVTLLIHYWHSRVQTAYLEKTRSDLFAKTVDASWTFLMKQKVGYLDNILFVDVTFTRTVLLKMSSVIVQSASILIYLLFALNISVEITLATIIFGGLILFSFRKSTTRVREDSHISNVFNKKVAHFVDECMIGMKNIKVLAVGEKVKEKVKADFKELHDSQMNILWRKKRIGTYFEPLSLLYIFAIFLFSYKSPEFNIAAFVVVIFLIQRIFFFAREVQSSLHTFSECLPYLRLTLSYLDEIANHRDEGLQDDQGQEFNLAGGLEFRDVSFSYGRGENVLEKINFKIAKGETIGVIGPSGSGKTTIADLILRLFKVSQGEILIDGENIEKVSIKDWRQNVGYVSQDVFLVNGTIAENISFYNEKVSEEDMIIAAKQANIYDFIRESPKGFATPVGERGNFLSVGQRQRIALARILARKPKVLILDEATSALGAESEKVIQEVIDKLHGELTIVIIAHRIKTVMSCDHILVVKDGKLLEEGQPETLLANGDSYFNKVTNLN